MKNTNWLSFLSGVLVGAGITWLFTSEEGKKVMGQAISKGKELNAKIEKELADLNDEIGNWSHKQKTS